MNDRLVRAVHLFCPYQGLRPLAESSSPFGTRTNFALRAKSDTLRRDGSLLFVRIPGSKLPGYHYLIPTGQYGLAGNSRLPIVKFLSELQPRRAELKVLSRFLTPNRPYVRRHRVR